MMPPDEPRVSMFRQWSIARMARLVASLVCPNPACLHKDLPNQKPMLDLLEDGTAYCNKCSATWTPNPEAA